MIKVRSLGFPAYHGIHWHPLAPRPRGGEEWLGVHRAIDYWVVHSREDALRYRDRRVFFAFLPSSPSNRGFAHSNDVDVFVGGRQNRDFLISFQAVSKLERSAIFLSDLLPDSLQVGSNSPIELIRERVPKSKYIEVMSRGLIIGIPLSRPSVPRAQGQTDASLAMALGIPIIATRDASVNDYVSSGETGFLVPNTKRAWEQAIEKILCDYESFRARALARRHLASWERFRQVTSELRDERAEPGRAR